MYTDSGQVITAAQATAADAKKATAAKAVKELADKEVKEPKAKAEAVAAALSKGDRVTVKETSRDDLNGQSGTVKDYDAVEERFHVTLDNGQVLALRGRNLQKFVHDHDHDIL